jgi:competence protein CoiA
MLLAVSRETAPERIVAAPGVAAACPGCEARVIPKCGEIVRWHWSHEARRDCDPWSEPETDWHLGWKARFPRAWCEVVMGPHRADVQCANGSVLEFQHRPIAPAEIREREEFYGKPLVWVFDVREPASGDLPRLEIRSTRAPVYPARSPFRTFRWTRPRRSLATVSRPLWFDLGADVLLEVRRMYTTSALFGGWGYLRTGEDFVALMTSEWVP